MDEQISITIEPPQAMPCPFCGCKETRVAEWWDDDGEYDAIECMQCKGCAPADVWNRREGDARRL